MNNWQLRTLCSKMKNNKKNDGLLCTIFFSKLRILLSKSDHEFILKINIDPDSPLRELVFKIKVFHKRISCVRTENIYFNSLSYTRLR